MFARQQAIDDPGKPAIIMASSGETVTFGEYEARGNRVAHLLRDAGLRRGDHIAVLMENSPQLLEIEAGVERTGLYYSLINTYLGAEEVAYVVANSQWLALVERYRVTHCQMVPVMFNRLLRLPGEVRARYDTSSLECIVHAAAPCPVHVKQAMIDWLGPIITEYYGATEANGFTFCTTAEWLAHPGTVGRSIRGELLILDAAGNQCPTGLDGTIWFRGATAFEYFQDPAKTAESRSADGEASTIGDIGHLDADGFLYLTDRQSYMIISGGVNIYPQETENILSAHPAVQDVAVIGVPNDDRGEEVKAVVQLADPAAAGPDLAQDLIAYCRDRLAHFKCPQTVDFVPELPRSETGKLYKRILRDAYWQNHNSPIV